MNEATDMAQNRPLWRLDVYVWCYALIVVHARNERVNEHVNYLCIDIMLALRPVMTEARDWL